MEFDFEYAVYTLGANMEVLQSLQESILQVLEQLPQIITFAGGFIGGSVVAVAVILEFRKW
jgi:hypothetical protein